MNEGDEEKLRQQTCSEFPFCRFLLPSRAFIHRFLLMMRLAELVLVGYCSFFLYYIYYDCIMMSVRV